MARSMPERFSLGASAVAFVVGVIGWLSLPARGWDLAGPMFSLYAIWLSAGSLAVVAWWVSGHPGESASRLVAAVGLAATASLSAVPLARSVEPVIIGTSLTIAALAVLPLVLELSGRVSHGSHRDQRTRAAVIALVSAAIAIGWLGAIVAGPNGAPIPNASPPSFPGRTEPYIPTADLTLRWLLLSVAVLVPAALAARSMLKDPHSGMPMQQRILGALGFGVAGILPAITGLVLTLPTWPWLALLLFVAAGTALLLVRIAIRPLARLAGSAISQRDLIVAASEAERVRLAEALHDGPLGDIALLVQRLDATGDADDAAIARSIADDLRAIGNDLRLPILDDLGAGPALEWLVDRVARRAGAEVHLALESTLRPPAEVELAVYRIAQEALVNAIKHGRPPVMVRYASGVDSVSLTVDDDGPGLAVDASVMAQQEGRLGLVSMSQRAEAIGARLVLAARPSGGTHVGLTWRPAGV